MSWIYGSDAVMPTKTQINKLKKLMANGTGSDIKISKTQIRKVVQQGGSLWSSLLMFSLWSKMLPYAMKGVSKV